MSSSTVIRPVLENIFAVEAPCEPGVDVRALLVCGERSTILLDTLAHPDQLNEVRELVASIGLPLMIVNSHADWDHWWGNAAFAEAPVIAHRRTLARQLAEGKRTLRARQRKEPHFNEVTLRPATIAFEGELELDLGGLHVELHLLPGHTSDCTVAYLPERRLLFAGDAAEDPIPLVGEGSTDEWSVALQDWASRARIVVPAHGSIAGPELLRRNAAYLHGLRTAPNAAVPELADATAFYKRAHRRNVKRAATS
ncbi:MAG TPA: MBL fold metallo-hydrolase [Chloroflexota bacterium]